MTEAVPSAVQQKDRATLTIDGRAHAGWDELRLIRSIESLSGEYEFSLAPRDYSDQPRWPLRTGSACTIEVGGKQIASCFIDALDAEYDGSRHGIRVTARDRTADLIDCSAIAKPGSWSGRKIEAIISELVQPFGIALDVAADTGAPLRKFALQQGETVFSAIDRLARFRGLLPITASDGRLQLVKPGAPDNGGGVAARLIEGVNIISARASHDARERFSDYLVKGQSAGDDRANGRDVAAMKGEARDAGIGRYRPLLVIGEDQASAAELKDRAAWEASVRAGRAQRAVLTVAGWHQGDGSLWEPNVRVMVSAPGLFIEGLLLVSEVALVKSNDGTLAELTVTPAEAWTLLPVKEEDPAQIGRREKVRA